jgi:hypothetical protein
MNALSKREIAALREGDVVYVRMVVCTENLIRVDDATESSKLLE